MEANRDCGNHEKSRRPGLPDHAHFESMSKCHMLAVPTGEVLFARGFDLAEAFKAASVLHRSSCHRNHSLLMTYFKYRNFKYY